MQLSSLNNHAGSIVVKAATWYAQGPGFESWHIAFFLFLDIHVHRNVKLYLPCLYMVYTWSGQVWTQSSSHMYMSDCVYTQYVYCTYTLHTLSYSVYTFTCIVHRCFLMFAVTIIHSCLYVVHTRLNCPCNRHVLCYRTGIQYPVHTVFSNVCKGYCRWVAFLWHFCIFPYKHVCQLMYLDKLSMYCE